MSDFVPRGEHDRDRPIDDFERGHQAKACVPSMPSNRVAPDSH
jgi:hypothetical protein